MFVPEELRKLHELVEKLDKHPQLDKVITVADNGDHWLNAHSIIQGSLTSYPDLNMLVDELYNQVIKLMISETGQNTKWFYEIRKYDYYTYTSERDSFGPLGAVIIPPSRKWKMSYG
jgi:hypothetical protein